METAEISIQLIGYTREEDVAEAIKMVLEQDIEGSLEINICDPDGCISRDTLDEQLDGRSLPCPVNIVSQKDDSFGVLSAAGDLIALCCAGERWLSGQKLKKQKEALGGDGRVLTVHDVEFLKDTGYPCDPNQRRKYLEQFGYEDKNYGMRQLQHFVHPGVLGTWMFKNIFRDDTQRKIFSGSGLDPEWRVLGMLMCRGSCVNLVDQRLVSCQMDQEEYQQRYFPKYDQSAIEAKKQELEEMRLLLEHYGVEMNTRYRMVHIANGAFNAFAETEPTEDSVALFMQAYTEAYQEEYDDKNRVSPEKRFFNYLRNKVQQYELKRGTGLTMPLAEAFRCESISTRARLLPLCHSQELKKEILEQSGDEQAVLDRMAKNKEEKRASKKKKNIFKRLLRKARNLIKRFTLRWLRKRGFSSYMSNEWFETVYKNLFQDHQTPLKTKLWCYRRGFMPWRIEQYGLTEENFQEFLSDRDYMYLHQINNSYKKWIEDKMTFRYVLEPFKQHLPQYYFQIIQRDDRQLILKLQDCPEGYEATFDELFRLLREKGKLAFKSASGTHGIGFYKVEHRDGRYYVNNKVYSEYGLRDLINRFKSFYIVTEYINMHDDMKALYAGAVNTIRVMMINRDGHHPQLLDAYMRIGSVKSGVTDNVAYGGVVCSIDMETGEYGNGLQLIDHKYVSIERHPDTDTELCGTVPNWELIKTGLKDISAYLPQLEYLGFDVVCTPEGFVILEVNSHQDLHRFPNYDQQIKDFYFYKLRRKERRYKIKRSYWTQTK